MTDENITKYTEIAREFVLAAWPRIVRGLIAKAAEGGYQQAKLLLDISNLNTADASQLSDRRRGQLCDVLLEGLGLAEGTSKPAVRKAETKQA